MHESRTLPGAFETVLGGTVLSKDSKNKSLEHACPEIYSRSSRLGKSESKYDNRGEAMAF